MKKTIINKLSLLLIFLVIIIGNSCTKLDGKITAPNYVDAGTGGGTPTPSTLSSVLCSCMA